MAIREIFIHKHIEDNGDIIDIRIFEVEKSSENPEGISYSLVYIQEGKRLIGYDNFEGHRREGEFHHKHVGDRLFPYDFVDEWKLLADFNENVEKVKRGTLP